MYLLIAGGGKVGANFVQAMVDPSRAALVITAFAPAFGGGLAEPAAVYLFGFRLL